MRSILLLVILAVVMSAMTVSLALAQDDPAIPPEGDKGEARNLPGQVCKDTSPTEEPGSLGGSIADVIYAARTVGNEEPPISPSGPCVLVTPEFIPEEQPK